MIDFSENVIILERMARSSSIAATSRTPRWFRQSEVDQ